MLARNTLSGVTTEMAETDRRSIRLVVQSSLRMTRSALGAHLASQPDIDVIGQTATLKGLHTLCSLYRPDVSLIDIGVLNAPAVESLRRLRAAFPTTELV